MAGDGRWTRYGQEAAAALHAELARAKATEALAPVTVVVASNQVGVSVRRQLASGSLGPVCGAGPGLIGVNFLTPYRLAELLGAASLAAEGRRPVSTPLLSAAIRGVLTTAPGVFAPVADHPATEAALVASYRELRDLTSAALDRLAAQGGRAAEVVRVALAARAAIQADWYDEEDLMTAVEAVVGSSAGAHALASVGTLIAYLPQRLSLHAARLLQTAGTATGLTVIAGITGDPWADAEVATSVSRLGVELNPPAEPPDLADVVTPQTTRLITASDADDEVRAAVRTVVDAVRAGTSLDRIAVLHASPEPYARLLHDHLDAAGVSVNGTAEVPLAGRLAGRTLLGLLDLPSTGFRRQDVFAWITGAPVHHHGRWAPATSWERISRSAGVVAGREDWDVLLTNLAERNEAEADEIERADDGEDVATWRVDRARADAERARSLRTFVLALVDRLGVAAQSPRGWGEQVAWTKKLVAELLGGPSRQRHWPDVERRAAERVDLALDRLQVLDEVEGPVTLDVFTRTLAAELESDLGRTGRFGEGVLVGPVSMGVGVDLELVVIVGMAEGTFPATLRDDSLLPDEERRATGDELSLRSGHVDRLHHQFLATLAGADRHVLCIPKGDLRRSRERVPSRWVLDVAFALSGTRWKSAELAAADDLAWIEHVASFDAGLRRQVVPATAQEHRLRRLLAAAPARRDLHATASAIDQTLADGVEVVDARTGPALTRFDGNLDAHQVPSPVDSGTSATRLEAWASCPHAYLLATVLRVEPLEQPEDSLQITALDKGNLVHDALETFIKDALAHHRVPAPADAWTDDDHDRLRAFATDLCEAYEDRGLTGRPIFWQRERRRILEELDRFLTEDDTHRRTTATSPVAAELPFGLAGAPSVAFPLPDGRTIPVRGKADRVDRAEDGTLHVVDYKTGKSDRFKGLSAEDPHQGGQHLQLAVYGHAARQLLDDPDATVRADYWFTSTRGKFLRLGYEVTDDVLSEVSSAMGAIVAGIEGGLFPAHPKDRGTSPFNDCRFCDPDDLGTNELLRQWGRKQEDPIVAPYLALISTDPEDAT